MDVDHWIKLLETLISLLQVLVWPFIIGLAILYLGKTLKNYVDDLRKDKNVSELSAEVGTTGVKLNVKRQVELVKNFLLFTLVPIVLSIKPKPKGEEGLEQPTIHKSCSNLLSTPSRIIDYI